MKYIVSGLERSGTSLMMQMLNKGGVPVAYDDGSRPADYHNPKGYYELEGGKTIRRLMDGTFPISKYEGVFIKVTAYGLKFLPEGEYKIIYMERDIDEVLDSTERMDGALDREKAKPLLEKLNQFCIGLMERRSDMEHLLVSYSSVLGNSMLQITRVASFLGKPLDREAAVSAVDQRLYRNRR